MDGAAAVAETAYTPFQSAPNAAPVRLIVRRVQPTPGSQLALFVNYSYYGFITDRDGDTLELEADHRGHAEIENAIRDLKYGVGLNHLPSGRFAANGAWLAVQVMAHNLARWAARIGLGEQVVTTKTLRRRFFSIAGRLTRSARRLTLHFPKAGLGKTNSAAGETARPATPFLTASDPSAGLLNRLADLRQAVPECLLLHVGCRSRPPPALRTVNIPSPRLPHPATSQIYRGQGLALPSPCLSSLVRPARYPFGGFGLSPNPPKRSQRAEGARKCSCAAGIMVLVTPNRPQTRSTQ